MFKVQALDGAYAWCKIHDAYISRKSAAMEDVLKCIGERYSIEGNMLLLGNLLPWKYVAARAL